ncbi:LytTR family DNA-binding domain-containing protein [Rhizorhabdus histidinilytica]
MAPAAPRGRDGDAGRAAAARGGGRLPPPPVGQRRTARLIAIEAHDHYLRVHTDEGVELLTMRFADAMAELAQAHGHRLHRSWWAAADAIEAIRWRRGGAGEARLAGGLTAPVSRAQAPALKAAGWF